MKKGKKIVLIVLAALLILTVGGLAFAGNYLFRFALDPEFGGMLSKDAQWELEGAGSKAMTGSSSTPCIFPSKGKVTNTPSSVMATAAFPRPWAGSPPASMRWGTAF